MSSRYSARIATRGPQAPSAGIRDAALVVTGEFNPGANRRRRLLIDGLRLALGGLATVAPIAHRAAAAQETPGPGDAPRAGEQAGSRDPGGGADGSPTTSRDDALAHAIVRRADDIRFPRESFQVEVRVVSTVGGQTQEPRRYRILSKGVGNTIVLTLEPSSERGQNLLMKGRELWVFMPEVSQPVRLSLSQRLTGQVANGDLARANFAGDYTPSLIGSERIEGHDHHVLELVAAERGVTYPKVRYWVRASNHFPHKAEFFSASGRLLKTCRYEQFQPLGGKVRPTRVVMTDALKSGDESIVEYSLLRAVDLPDRTFSKEYLRRL